ncbi:unnamed protein product [Cylicocyclus nassatus]|uniref:Peroxisomal biogenesis factor 3 n=1 Tax=Cylicocyclus nassatus TaxID=53992 RepID=A0AA36H3R5_CYLNA|nr:unnamed protein product [Cylicocyclus nassatus]
MTGTWEFIKKHKGKIIAGGVLISGAAAYMIQRNQETHRFKLANPYQNDFMIQERRRYIFDTNQRACDQSITDIVKELKTRVKLRFDVDALIRKLKENMDLSVEDKVELWDKVKVLSVARILGIAYAYSLLTVTLKAQISILAADLCAQLENPPPPSVFQTLANIKNQVVSYLGLDSSLDLEHTESNDSGVIAGNRRIFVQCTQYLVTSGIAKLLNFIEDVCNEVCSAVSLTDVVNNERIREVLDAADHIISKKDSTFFTDMIAPLSQTERSSSDGVLQLLTRLVRSIETEKCRGALSSLVDFYLTAAVQKIPSDSKPLAKLLPSFSEVFDVIASDAYDSPLQNSLNSSDIYHAMPNERRLLKLAASLANCAPEVAAYGACVARQAEKITKDACADEFSKLIDCAKKLKSKAK